MPQTQKARRRVPRPVPDYRGEPVHGRYSDDRAWMPEVVLVAKNTYVWLDQLRRKFSRDISTLADIPDEELDQLAAMGLTGLWLIGIWERSPASRRLKQRMGQPDADASAYSIYDYTVAADLGGEQAMADLQKRAFKRGIRLSADMVPNHLGIDSRWVVEHPERFLSLDEPPFPGYTFTSENLSRDPRVEIYLEDHYYDHTGTAVVFKRVDAQTRAVQYIYHGNDGTSFAWNDTAQLDYSRPDVRAAVMQTILHVAHMFPIIRFDAAMTLAREHIQRLWFPLPGRLDGIPSRAKHGMTAAVFDAAVPGEFWREVVDRVAAEAPDTLLLAEAFWMMEGYFVRTLGMHRVYNSAFMHMLRDEENRKYRQLIKNTLKFDSEILKRHVNFMSNPDEETALEQFGRGDKYFGTCMVMATLPGLPMFGHGQLEGLRERYGMEYRKPRLDESADVEVVRRHEQEIFPLLRRRALFAGADQFHLFDFKARGGRVNENVFAFSNRRGAERALVLYNNKHSVARGWLRISASALNKSSGKLGRRSLAAALELPRTGFVVFRDSITGLEYIRDCQDLWEDGLYVELAAYQHHAFLDWRIVSGDNWAALYRALKGAGIESVDNAREALPDAPPGPTTKVKTSGISVGRKLTIRARRTSHAATATTPKLGKRSTTPEAKHPRARRAG
ncbi:MAG TPA: alpha-amylase family glycosyl hydrolase [Anaerolineales bacterium]